MPDINVKIDAILQNCDESIMSLNFGREYQIRKVYFEDLSFKNKIVNGNNRIDICYLNSKMTDQAGDYFICLCKESSFPPPEIIIEPGVVINDKIYDEPLSDYNEEEMAYLFKIFSLLHLFKSGNIGYSQVFFEYHYKLLGLIDGTHDNTTNNSTRNIADTRKYLLTDNEVIECNTFLQDYLGVEYDLLKSCIEEFVWGLEQMDEPTGFEQYTTTLEMLLLETDERGKKEKLSKRISVLLESDSADITNLYNKMKNYYRYRSESLHEGNGNNITTTELRELEEIVRKALKKYLVYCKGVLQTNPSITWAAVKTAKIEELKNIVTTNINSGVLT